MAVLPEMMADEVKEEGEAAEFFSGRAIRPPRSAVVSYPRGSDTEKGVDTSFASSGVPVQRGSGSLF